MTKTEMLEKVYLSKRKVLLGNCRTLTGRSDDVLEDIIQAVFLRLWKSRTGFHDMNHCFRYIQKSCVNACIDLFRKERTLAKAQVRFLSHARSKPSVSEDLEQYEPAPLFSLALSIVAEICQKRQLPLSLFTDWEYGVVARHARNAGIPISVLRDRLAAARREIRKAILQAAADHGLGVASGEGKT